MEEKATTEEDIMRVICERTNRLAAQDIVFCELSLELIITFQ